MDKYPWYPTECAPAKFPVRIISGSLIFKDGSLAHIPTTKLVFNGWGQIGSLILVGDKTKPVPAKLDITWYSFSEDKFFAGTFDLPFDTIKAIFQKGFKSPINGKEATYEKIIVGLAPEGYISIWLAGGGIAKEAVFLKAKEANIPWERVVNNPRITRKDYVKMNLELALKPDEIASLAKNGIPTGLWKTYRIKYAWEPKIVGKASPASIWINTYNGEREYFDYKDAEQVKPETRAILSKFQLFWSSPAHKKYSGTVNFNEEEIFAAFTKLSAGDLTKKLQLQIEISDFDQSVKVFLRDDKFILELKKCDIKVYLG